MSSVKYAFMEEQNELKEKIYINQNYNTVKLPQNDPGYK